MLIFDSAPGQPTSRGQGTDPNRCSRSRHRQLVLVDVEASAVVKSVTCFCSHKPIDPEESEVGLFFWRIHADNPNDRSNNRKTRKQSHSSVPVPTLGFTHVNWPSNLGCSITGAHITGS